MLMPFGKHKGTPVEELPADYAMWLLDNVPIQSSMLTAALKERIRTGAKPIDETHVYGKGTNPDLSVRQEETSFAQPAATNKKNLPPARYNDKGWRILTLEELEYTWWHYARIFEKELGFRMRKPRLEICTCKTILGQWNHSGPRTRWKLRISNYWVMPKKEFFNTFVHEMCHEYITESGIKDSTSHGPEWKKVARAIGLKTGFNISATCRIRFVENPNKEERVIYVIEETDDKEKKKEA